MEVYFHKIINKSHVAILQQPCMLVEKITPRGCTMIHMLAAR